MLFITRADLHLNGKCKYKYYAYGKRLKYAPSNNIINKCIRPMRSGLGRPRPLSISIYRFCIIYIHGFFFFFYARGDSWKYAFSTEFMCTKYIRFLTSNATAWCRIAHFLKHEIRIKSRNPYTDRERLNYRGK